MSSWTYLDRRRVAWCIQVDGLPFRLCSSVGPGASVIDGRLYDYTEALVQSPVDLIDAVLDVGPIDGTLDDVSPVASQSPIEVSVLAYGARRADTGATVDPMSMLLRVAGRTAATQRVKLLSSLDHAGAGSGPVDIEVASDVSGWTTPGPIHIGQEVLWATSTSTVGGYWFVGATRGADLWATQTHAVNPTQGEQPWVTSEVTTWRGRRATIYVSALDEAGSALGWVQYWAGLLDSAPTYDGRTISLRIAPLTAAMSYRLGVGTEARSTTSVAGAHLLTTGIADTVDWIVSYSLRRIPLTMTAVNIASGAVTLDATSQAIIATLSSVRLVTASVDRPNPIQDNPIGYTSPDLLLEPGGAQVTQFAAALAAGRDTVYISGDVGVHSPLRLLDPALTSEVVAWPDRLLAVINEPQAWQTTVACWSDPDALGLQPRDARAQLSRPGAEWDVWAYLTEESIAWPAEVAWVRGGRACRAGWLIGETDAQVRSRRLPQRAIVREDRAITVVGNRVGDPDLNHYPHQGPTWWWYQSGEPYIGPWQDDVYTGSGTPQLLEITGSGETPVRIWITGSISDTHPTTGDTVYWYEVQEPDSAPCVLSLEDDPPLTCQVVAAAYGSEPMEYVASLLMSGVGNGDNGLADSLPIGANLPGTGVRYTAFAGFTGPPALSGQRYEALRGKTITEQTTGLMLACGVQIAQVIGSDGVWRIEPVAMSAADATQVVLSISDDDLVMTSGREPVSVVYDQRTVRSYVVRLNYRAAVSTDKPDEVMINTSTERNDAGADSGQPLVLDLPGVQIASAGGRAAAAAELVSDIRARIGSPRLRWVMTIRADKPDAIRLGLGSIVRLTSTWAIGIDPTTTASNTLCRVVGMRRDLVENTLRLELRPYGGIAGGWAQSATVHSVLSPTVLQIEPDDYSDADIQCFKSGDYVVVFTPGAWSARTACKIASVNTALNRLVFVVPHGAAPGDIIHADAYTTVTTSQQGQAYLADAGVLDVSDPGQIIA